MALISVLASSSSSSPFSAIKASSSVRRRLQEQLAPQSLHHPHQFNDSSSCGVNGAKSNGQVIERRRMLMSSIGLLAGALFNTSMDGVAFAAEFADMPALRGKDYGKTKMRYPDYTETESGLQYKDLRQGSGPTPNMGETVVVDWDGYTIGYYGRIFEARNKTKGGSFQGDDKDFFKFKLGSREVIPAFEEAVSGMALGGVRRYCANFTVHLTVMQDHSAPGAWISRERLQKKWAKANYIFGPASLGFCAEKPRIDRQDFAV